jgi:hypothetical protein
MDTSKEYIKMCDCPEIQDKWEQSQAGDFYFMRDSLFCPTKITGNYNGDGWKLLPRTANYGWLPSQDQIQKMLQPIELHELLEVCMEPDGIMQIALHEYAESMEQLWLAFYMFEEHKKTWEGDEWIK